jgi:energy-coupling factor transporter ATP-binding protein EcfA2
VLLEGVRIENLRGFYDTSISLKNPRTLIVGPNNSGKTSLLRLLDWVLNELEPDDLRKGVTQSEEILAGVLPARQTRHRARRITLYLRLADGRSWTRFGCDSEGRVRLRVNVRLTPRPVVFVALGAPTRDESAASKSRAVELLHRLQDSVCFIHIPSFRDAASDRFGTTLSSAIRRRIDARAIHETQGGAPGEYRALSNSFEKIRRPASVEGRATGTSSRFRTRC